VTEIGKKRQNVHYIYDERRILYLHVAVTFILKDLSYILTSGHRGRPIGPTAMRSEADRLSVVSQLAASVSVHVLPAAATA